MDNLITALTSGGLSLILSGALVWICRNWISERIRGSIQHDYDQKVKAIEHAYAEKLESHKAQLKAVNDTELERLKAQLQTAAAERHIKLTSIFEKQAEVVVTVYQKLVKLSETVYAAVIFKQNRNAPPDAKELELIRNMRIDFHNYFKENKIYLPRETALKAADFENQVSYIKTLFDLYMEELPRGHEQRSQRQLETYDKLHTEIPALLTLLEDEFQEILGVPKAKQAQTAK